jgi:uncharacterized delta-60 repeat protein
MSLIQLGFWAASGAASINHWIATLGGASSDSGSSIGFGSSGNVYFFGDTASAGSGSNDFLLAQSDPDGSIQWQRVLGGASAETGKSVAVDNSENLYSLGNTSTQGAGALDFLLAKYNSSGAIQWQRVLGGATNEFGNFVAVDSSSNVYAFGATQSQGAGSFDFLLAKYNSSGTIQWQRVLGSASDERGNSVSVDASGDVYFTGLTTLAKYNSSGTIQWQRSFAGMVDSQSVATDSSGNVFINGFTSTAGPGARSMLIAKYNSSGTLQWQRVLGGSGDDRGTAIAADSSGNCYALGITDSDGEGNFDFLLAKYDASGNIQWQRTLGASGLDVSASISIDSAGTLYVLGYSNSTGAGSNDFLAAKLPSDGSLTGTYVLDGVNMVYAASSLTGSTSTFASSTSNLTSATSTLTAATSTLTDASASLTSHLTLIP